MEPPSEKKDPETSGLDAVLESFWGGTGIVIVVVYQSDLGYVCEYICINDMCNNTKVSDLF